MAMLEDDKIKQLLEQQAPGLVGEIYKSFRKSDNIDDRRGENFKIDPNRSAEEKALDGTFLLDDYGPDPDLNELAVSLGAAGLDGMVVKQLLQPLKKRLK